MNGSLARIALMVIFLQLSCSAAQAVTGFDSNIRPDGACDANANINVYVAPTEDGTQIVLASTPDPEVVGDAFDSGD